MGRAGEDISTRTEHGDEHIVVDFEAGFVCTACGVSRAIDYPIALLDWVAGCEAFVALHRECARHG